MTLAGWAVMALAILGMTGLLVWCIHKVVSTPESYKHLHAQTDIDPHDKES